MAELQFLIGREHVDPRLLMRSDPSIARVMGQMNQCTCFSAMDGTANVAACLLNESASPNTCEVENLAIADGYDGQDIYNEMLAYVMSYAKEKGLRYAQIGLGNANLEQHKILQKMGYRVIGVIQDHYQSDGKSMSVENGIVNRDMLRYRVDFQDGWTTWTKEVKYKFEG